MKAAFIKQIGAPDVIEYGEVPMPEIDDQEVLVKVSAVAVNPVDTYFRSGKYQFPDRMPIPYIVGRDMVGVVTKVGKKTKEFKPGQRVWCNSAGMHGKQGCFAEYVALNEESIYSAPDEIDDISIVSVISAAATACLGLTRVAMLKASEIIFVNGGGGNVGSSLIQLAVARGAHVIAATTGQEKIEWCKSLGADLVLDYKKNDLFAQTKAYISKGVDVFWDTSRHPNFELSIPLLAHKGRMVLMAGYDAHPSFPVGVFYQKECTLKGLSMLKATPLELKSCAEIINRCLQENKLKSKVSNIFTLKDTAKAHALLESESNLWGKIVLKI